MDRPVHIDISQQIDDWKNAIYGEEVREANVEALTKLQDQANGAIDYIVEKGTEIDQTVEEVNHVKQEAEQAVSQAQEYASNAQTSAEAASQSEAAAEQSEIVSKNSAEAAKNEADRASMYANFVTPHFLIQGNRLYINDDSTVSFEIYDNKLYFKLPTVA